jgi:lipoprotein-anchoring transpeptidase ErfK/SrfK
VEPGATSPPAKEAGRDAGLERDRRLAQASLDAGDSERGLRILRGMYVYAKDRPGVDLSSDVRRLLEEETDRQRRREYLDYLASRDRTGATFQEQLERCARELARVEDDRDAALAAWDELTIAYELAGDRAGKEKVMALVEPFLQQMVFSGAYTPLLVSYSIQPGDNLTAIARRHGTTVRAIKRINGLSSDHIQARQRLRILPGGLKIFVDKSDFVLWATVDDRIFLEFPVGIGRKSAITPVGTFKVDDRTENPTWYRPGQPPLPPGHPENVLGTRWIGFADTAEHQGIGIHGTADPGDVGTRSSSGCIRLCQDDVELLFDFVDHGTEVVVRP